MEPIDGVIVPLFEEVVVGVNVEVGVPVLSVVIVAVEEIVEVRVPVIVSEFEGVTVLVFVVDDETDTDCEEVIVPLEVTVAEFVSV